MVLSHIILYEIDSFGFVLRFIKKGLRLMSEEDLTSDENLRKSLEAAKYDCWKRYNVIDLIAEYDRNIFSCDTLNYNFCTLSILF